MLLINSAIAALAVNTTSSDLPDYAPGDGVCEATLGAGDCTLRAAVEESEAVPGTETIVLGAGSSILTLGELLIQDSLRITGIGASSVIDGNGDRLFMVDNGNLALAHLDLTGGDAAWGGALLILGGRVRLSAVSAYNNHAEHQGGVVFMTTGTLEILDSQAWSNEAEAGGVFSGGGTLTVATSSFKGNLADYSGGVLAITGQATVTKCTFAANEAWSSGGAINAQGDLSVESSVFEDNIAGAGGAIAAQTGTLSISDSLFSGNIADFSNGGAIYSNGPAVRIGSSTFSGNYALQDGGAISLSAMPPTRIDVLDSSFVRNSSDLEGGAVKFGNGDIRLGNSTLAYNATLGQGGGLYALNGTVRLEHLTITGNQANLGGGVRTNATVSSAGSVLLADNAAATGRDCYGSVASAGDNLVGSTTGCSWSAGPGDQLNTAPALGGLSWSPSPGGTVVTLSSTSTAIDSGGLCSAYPRDQIGQARVGVCDVGAWEAP